MQRKDEASLKRLIGLIRALRGKNGCPWDREQTPRTMAGYLLEETYELQEAVESEDGKGVCEELGDVLFHLMFLIDWFEEKGLFDLERVVRGITEKMTRRHPHVFGDTDMETTDAVKGQWQRIKAEEKKEAEVSLLSGVPRRLPALTRALRVSERAAAARFDWDAFSGVMEKAKEEWNEFEAELRSPASDSEKSGRISMELGDLFFTLVNVARFLHVDPEAALHDAVKKFERRFQYMERQFAENKADMASVPQSEKDAAWERAKAQGH